MHQTRENKCCLPKNVLVVWAVKRSKELSLLSMIDPKLICPSISEIVYLEIQTYVTQELEPPLVSLDYPLLDAVFHLLQNKINLS